MHGANTSATFDKSWEWTKFDRLSILFRRYFLLLIVRDHYTQVTKQFLHENLVQHMNVAKSNFFLVMSVSQKVSSVFCRGTEPALTSPLRWHSSAESPCNLVMNQNYNCETGTKNPIRYICAEPAHYSIPPAAIGSLRLYFPMLWPHQTPIEVPTADPSPILRNAMKPAAPQSVFGVAPAKVSVTSCSGGSKGSGSLSTTGFAPFELSVFCPTQPQWALMKGSWLTTGKRFGKKTCFFVQKWPRATWELAPKSWSQIYACADWQSLIGPLPTNLKIRPTFALRCHKMSKSLNLQQTRVRVFFN